MKTIGGLAFVGLLLLSWLCFIGTNASAPRDDQARTTLDRFVAIESSLRESILNARLGLLRNYDPLDRETMQLHQLVLRLRSDGIAASVVDPLGRLVDQQDDLTERFKSDNALLQNALAYFGLLSGIFSLTPRDGSINPDVATLSTAVLKLILDPSSASATQVHDSLERLSVQPVTGNDDALKNGLLAHGWALYRLLPATNTVLRSLYLLPFTTQKTIIWTAILVHQKGLHRSADHYRLLLYAVSLLLLLLLMVLGAKLRQMLQTLRRRAAFERGMADISMQFVAAGSSDTRAAVEAALAQLATWVGADRAYFIVAASAELYAWSRDGNAWLADWPTQRPIMPSNIARYATEILYLPSVNSMAASPEKETLLANGLKGWLHIPTHSDDSVEHILGFEALTKAMSWPSADLGLLRVAADNVANAVSRAKLERERARLEASLQRARRMETVGALTSGVAHNFNNVIGAILGHTEMQEAEVVPGSRVARHVQGVRQAAEHARDLVEQILHFGRQKVAPPRNIVFSTLMSETQTQLMAVLPSPTRLIVAPVPQAAVVQGDAAQLQQIIMNLCINAFQAIDGSGVVNVSIDVQLGVRASKLSHGAVPAGSYVRICVKDTGRGMNAETSERLFEPFFTTRPEGNGLGLATVYEIVTSYGGAIDVTSRLGAGSNFEVWLPLAKKADGECTTGRKVKQRPGGGEAVVIINENPERLLHDEEIVAALGYEPVGYLHLEQALDAFRSEPQRFDIILIANVSSVARALAFATDLHAELPWVPILLAAPHGGLTADLLAAAGIYEVVKTPVTSADLASVLPKLLSRQPS